MLTSVWSAQSKKSNIYTYTISLYHYYIIIYIYMYHSLSLSISMISMCMVRGINFGANSPQVTLYVNASTCTEQYNPTHKPIVFDLPPAHELREATKKAALERKEGKLQLWVWLTTWIWDIEHILARFKAVVQFSHFGLIFYFSPLLQACAGWAWITAAVLKKVFALLPGCLLQMPLEVPPIRIVTHTQCMQFLLSARACPSTSWVRSISWFEQIWRFAKRHLKCPSLRWHRQKDDLSDQTAPGWRKMIESTLRARHVFRVAALQKSPWSINWLVPRDPKGVSKLQECFLKPCYMLPIAAMYGDINLLLPLRPAANGSSSPKDLGKLAEGWRLLLLLFGFLGSLSYSAWYPKLRKSFA